MREADDVGERGAQHVGHVVHEAELELVGPPPAPRWRSRSARSTVDRVGHVLERDQRRPVGQRHRRAIDHAAVVAPIRHDTDRRSSSAVTAERCARQVASSRCSGRHQAITVSIWGRWTSLVDSRHMRSNAGCVQPHPPVAAEHRDRLGQVVERLALHADERIEPARELEPFGDVVDQIGDAAFRVGVVTTRSVRPVRQVPFVLDRLDRLIGFVQLALPFAEIALLRQLAGRAQAVEHGGSVGCWSRKAGSKSHSAR